MSNNLGVTFWTPLLLAAASAAFAIFWASTDGWGSTALVACLLTAVFIGFAYLLAKWSASSQATGGTGGNADALGDESEAIGGTGGRGLAGRGGAGGNAVAKGVGSKARGGRGGDA